MHAVDDHESCLGVSVVPLWVLVQWCLRPSLGSTHDVQDFNIFKSDLLCFFPLIEVVSFVAGSTLNEVVMVWSWFLIVWEYVHNSIVCTMVLDLVEIFERVHFEVGLSMSWACGLGLV